jgi:hypothetical protein
MTKTIRFSVYDTHGNPPDVLRIVCASAGPQRDRIFTKYLSDMLDHATSPASAGPAAANLALTR